MGGTWAVRAHDACDTVVWMAKLNLCWLVGTIAGFGLFGVAPATAAAAIVIRRRSQGRTDSVADFARAYRAEFLRSQPVILPVVIVLCVLAANYQWFSLLGPQATTARLATLVTLVVAIGAAAYVAPLYVHYDLPRWRYPVWALRIALARPLWTVLLIFVAVTIAFVSARWWVLVPLISIGAWLHASTSLCLRFFAENEDRLRARQDPSDRAHRGEPAFTLPADPLRTH